jgi:hypothetical protein
LRKGYTGKAKADTYPIPQEFTFDEEGTTLDNFTIKAFTRLVYKKNRRKPPDAIKSWENKIAEDFAHPPTMDWARISQIYTSNFLSLKD